MTLGKATGPLAVGVLAALITTVVVSMLTRSSPKLDVLLEPAGATGPDPFMVLDSPDLRMGAAEPLTLGGPIDIRIGIEPGLYGGSGSDHLCDPQLIADFLAQDPAKASAWAFAAGIEVDAIEAFLQGLTPVRLLADTWVTNHGYRDGKATSRQAILQAGTMVLVDDLGVPRVRCKCGNPLLPPRVPSDLDRVVLVGEAWEGFDPERLLVIETGDEAVEWFILVRLEDGRLMARPVGTVGDQDIPVDDEGDLLPALDLDLPTAAAAGDGPFPLPAVSSSGEAVSYRTTGPCQVVGDRLILSGQGRCVLIASHGAAPPWGPFEARYEIEVGRLDQEIQMADIGVVTLGGGAIELGAVADSLLPVEYEASGPCEMAGTELVPTGTGTCEVTVTQPGDDRWAPADPLVTTVEITSGSIPRVVTIGLDLPPSIRLDGDTISLEASTTPDRPVTYLAAGACALAGTDTLTPRTVGQCEVVAVAAGDTHHQRAVTRAALTVLPRQQTLGLDRVPLSTVLSDAAIPLPATSSAGFDITYDVSGNCRLTAQGLVLTGTGRCTIAASAEGDAETEPASETRHITIAAVARPRQGQTITFARPTDLAVGGAAVRISATASSGLPVTLTVTEGECRLNGSSLAPGGAGRCTVVASQTGDTDYEPAPSVARTVTVAKLTPTLTVSVTGGSASEMLEGESRTVTGAVSAGPSAAVTATSGPCTHQGSVVTAASGSADVCVVTVAAPGDADHNPVSATTSIAIKRRQTIDLTVPATSIVVGARLRPQASSSAGLPVTLSAEPSRVCGMEGGAVVGAGAGRCTITAAADGDASYAPASRSVSIDVEAKRVPSVAIVAPGIMMVGDTATLSATSSEPNVTITMTVSGAACQDLGDWTISAVAVGTCTVTATHPATAEAEAGSARATITVAGQTDTISFACKGSCDPVIGQSVAVTITTRSGITPSASVAGPCTIVGDRGGEGQRVVTVRGDSAGTCTLSASSPGDSAWQPASDSRQLTVTPRLASVSFELGGTMVVGEQRSFDVSHNIPPEEVTASISHSAGCTASIIRSGQAAIVVAEEAGTCTVTVTVSAPGYTTAKHTDTVPMTVLR